MDILYDFSTLLGQVKRLGAAPTPFVIQRAGRISLIEKELLSGKAVSLDEIDNIDGLITVDGRQVLLYIPDQGTNILAVLQGNKKDGKKFHVAHCTTLEAMKKKNRFERYIATTDISGEFDVQGIDFNDGTEKSGTARLYVCQNCLTMLNYKQAKVNKSAARLRESFDLAEFFETYSSCFTHLPSRTKMSSGDSYYSTDWKTVSENLRSKRNWCCEECGVDLGGHKQLLHVHHINGVKSNNHEGNLKVLCSACHRLEPMHESMYVPRKNTKQINRLRRDQGLLARNWPSVMRFADPALHGLLGLLNDAKWAAPDIEFPYLEDESLELAWPDRNFGVSLSHPLPASKSKWTINGVVEATSRFK